MLNVVCEYALQPAGLVDCNEMITGDQCVPAMIGELLTLWVNVLDTVAYMTLS